VPGTAREKSVETASFGVGLAVGGGVVAGVGLALALTAPSARPSPTALRCAPALGMTGVGCTLRF